MKKKLLLFDLKVCLGLVLLSIFLYIYGLGVRHFWAPDEPRFAEAIREMIQTGDYLIPRVNGQVYPNKPPLYYWLAALFARFGEVSEWNARMPSAVAAMISLITLYFLGIHLFRRRWIALYGTLMLAINAYFLPQARFVQMDMLLLCFVLLSYYGFLRLLDTPQWRWSVLAYLSLGLSVLAKGPLGVILVAMGGFAHFLTQGLPLREWLRLFGNRYHLAGIPLFLVSALSWNLAFLFTSEPHFFYEYFIRQNFGRFIGTYESHIQPVWYYFKYLPVVLLPWTPFLPAFWLVFRKQRQNGRIPSAVWSLLLWFALGFFFFTLSKSKQAKYLLPLLPGVSLVMGWCLWHIQKSSHLREWRWSVEWVAKGLASLLALALAALPIALWNLPPFLLKQKKLLLHFETPQQLAQLLHQVFTPILLLALVGIPLMGLWWYLLRKKIYSSIVYIPLVLALFGSTFVAPPLLAAANHFKSAKFLSEKMVQLMNQGPQGPWCMFGIYRSAFVFYTKSFCVRLSSTDIEKGLAKEDYRIRFRRFLREHPVAYILTIEPCVREIPERARPHLELLLKRRVGKKLWLFYRWRRPPGWSGH